MEPQEMLVFDNEPTLMDDLLENGEVDRYARSDVLEDADIKTTTSSQITVDSTIPSCRRTAVFVYEQSNTSTSLRSDQRTKCVPYDETFSDHERYFDFQPSVEDHVGGSSHGPCSHGNIGQSLAFEQLHSVDIDEIRNATNSVLTNEQSAANSEAHLSATSEESSELIFEGRLEPNDAYQRSSYVVSVSNSNMRSENIETSDAGLVQQDHSSYSMRENVPHEATTTHKSLEESTESSSVRKWTGTNPLRRFSVIIGKKKLNFQVTDARIERTYGVLKCDEELVDSREMRYTCFVCSRLFPTSAAVRDHSAKHSNMKRYRCSFCGRTFIHKQSLHFHERIHTGEKPFQCPICTKCFARATNYNVHMKLHASGRRYFCSCCGKWFRFEPEMLDHQQQCVAQLNGEIISTDRPLRYQCSYCSKMFHHRRDKNIHERTHTGERPYSCGYCGKGFTQSQALTIHIRTHTGEKPYSCCICPKTFRDSSALRKHEFMKHTFTREDHRYLGNGSQLSVPGDSNITSDNLQPLSPSYH
ncbi:hypothetical protein AB6A40_002586 [Gnathostoma spinigerum]|uniref:C2H2-type domain-containing protein n=1 Tax=Gnathostoma spinigerum TaxID=75299 RepID=A0ABD6EH43_9BILA